jgi:hypothetical protein
VHPRDGARDRLDLFVAAENSWQGKCTDKANMLNGIDPGQPPSEPASNPGDAGR